MLDDALRELAGTPVLLVATDFDGTLARIVPHPDDAEALPRARRALSTLARQPHTRVAVISGRGLTDLQARLEPSEAAILLIGSHGSEFEPDRAGRMDADERRLRDAIREAVDAAAAGLAGVTAEHKDVSSCLHYRNASREDAVRAICRLRARRAALPVPGPAVRRGKKVVEWLALRTDKGMALERLRTELGATAVIFLGDDRTDEDAFRALGADDVTVKVGSGPTAAGLRVDGPDEAADLLGRLAEMRARALRESVTAPIADMGFLSDRRTGALVTPLGEVCWLCPGRFDQPSVFASLLGGPTAGRFVVRPATNGSRGHQRYRGDSLVLETRWAELSVIDYLDPAAAEATGGTVLVRRIVPHAPSARCRIELAPRHDYGRRDTRLERQPDGLSVRGGVERSELVAPGVDFRIERMGAADVARAEVVLDGPLCLVFRSRADGVEAGAPEAVARAWSEGADALVLPPRWTEEVLRSALVLRGLVYAPTGAMVAALTTSLPEAIGGERNWDYRFCWLRDTAYACDALLRLGSLGEAAGFLDWLCRVVHDADATELRPLYCVGGEPAVAEAELGHLIGYGASQPVRVGNAAAGQLQVDVFGAIVDLLCSYVAHGGALDDRLWRLAREMIGAIEVRWREPDAGIWELRHAERHHVHSKVMSWLAVDRALDIARRTDRAPGDGWRALRDEIAADILAHGWHEARGAFTTAYGVPDLDAAALAVVLSGLLSPDDPRAVATVEAIERALCTGNTVYRYRFDDGFRGHEGGFHICASWLVEALVLVGRRSAAEHLFTQIVGAAGSTGLLSEEIDPATGAALGNVPQAYSHTGVIWNALTLTGSPKARTARIGADAADG